MSKNKIAPKGLPKYVVTANNVKPEYCRAQASAVKTGKVFSDMGFKKVHMFKISYDFYETFSAKK